MQRVFGKNFHTVFLVALIFNLVVTSSPMRALLSLMLEAAPSPQVDTIVFAEPQVGESSAGLVPQS